MKVEFNSVTLQPHKNGLSKTKERKIEDSNVSFKGNIQNTPKFKTVGLSAAASKHNIHVVNSSKNINNLCPANFNAVTFTGNYAKNVNQIASVAPECQDILNQIYKAGGLGNVVGEASVAMHDHGGADIRTFIPYHSPGNSDGGIQIRRPLIKDGAQMKWETPKGKIDAFEFIPVDINYQLKQGEEFVVHEPVIQGQEWKTGFRPLKDLGISGTVESVNESLSGMDKVPYRMFQIADTAVDAKGKPPVYIVHTPELAKFPKSYNAGATGSYAGAYGGGAFDDLLYSQFSKAVTDAMPKMDTDELGHFNPASFWVHDRQAFPVMVDMAERSSNGDEYWRGVKTHASFHNPGRGYQGHYKSPLDFLRIAGSKEDFEMLQGSKDFSFVQEMVKKIDEGRKEGIGFSPEDILSPEEMKKLNKVFKPIFGDFVDEYGEYNLCKIPIVGVDKNPHNMTAGTVSTTYGREMKNHNTREIADGLTRDFARTPTIDIVNGSTPANLHLDIIGDFGRPGNGFTEEIKKGFTPLTKEVMADNEKFFSAKQANKKWLLNTIGEVADDSEKLTKLFFDDNSVKNGASVLGGLSKYKEGDVLFIGWGRPDSQKGFPVTLEGFLQFLKDDSIDDSLKAKTKLLAGAGPWAAEAADWKAIQEQMKEIAELNGGKFKNNVCYVNGFFSNRLVSCSDYALITSRYEPCGITPLEAFSAGSPVLSNKTGGSPDFITPYVKGAKNETATGFLTKHAFFVNPEVIGADSSLTGEALDQARRVALGKENAQCIKEAAEFITDDPKGYKSMMSNAYKLNIDWHNNDAFNGGKSAMRRYFEDVWNIENIDGKFRQIDGVERCSDPMKNLKGTLLDITSDTGVAEAKNKKNSFLSFLGNMDKKTKISIMAGAAIIAAGTTIFAVSKHGKKKADMSYTQNVQTNKTTAPTPQVVSNAAPAQISPSQPSLLNFGPSHDSPFNKAVKQGAQN